jgi:precorrin-2 dehydrogenase/sirohydrochlorin ferrochelatase
MTLFTVNMRVADWPCLVVGAGAIALPKAKRLIEAGAAVTIIAPNAPDELLGATMVRREATLDDLEGVRLAIFGTDDKEFNRRLYHAAVARGILAAAVDDLENADFYMPAILRRGDLEVAVSSAGKGPAYSVWVRNRLAEMLDDAYGEALAWFAWLRRTHLRHWVMRDRTRAFNALLSRDFMPYFREGRVDAWTAEAEAILQAVKPDDPAP